MISVRKIDNHQRDDLQVVQMPQDNSYESLPEGGGNTMQYLRDMMKAILEIGEHYYRIEYENPDIDDVEQYERVFAYELYHQWSKYVESYHSQGQEFANLCLNGEIKKIHWEGKKLPDLVLHKQGEDCQEIIVEIKRNSQATSNNVFIDIEKLIYFSTGTEIGGERHRITEYFSAYNLGVFILTCSTSEHLSNLLKDKRGDLGDLLRELHADGNRIYCICIPTNGTLEYATLNDLLQQQ